MTIDLVVGNLRSKDFELKDKSNVIDELYVRGRFDKREKSSMGRSDKREKSSRGRSNKREKGTSRVKNKIMSKSKSKKHVRYYFCKNEGHYRNECSLRKGKKFEKHESSIDSDSNNLYKVMKFLKC